MAVLLVAPVFSQARVIATVNVASNPHDIAISETTDLAVVVHSTALSEGNSEQYIATLIDLNSRLIRTRIRVGLRPSGVAVHPTKPLAVVVGQQGEGTDEFNRACFIIDLAQKKAVASIRLEGVSNPDVAINPVTDEAFIPSSGKNVLHVVDLNTFALKRSIPVADIDRGVDLNPLTNHAAVGLRRGQVAIINLTSGEKVATTEGDFSGAYGLQVLAQPNQVLVAFDTGGPNFRRFDMKDGRLLGEQALGDFAHNVQAQPYGRYALTVCETCDRAFVVDLQGKTETQAIPVQGNPYYGIAYDPRRSQFWVVNEQSEGSISIIQIPTQLNFPRIAQSASTFTGLAFTNLDADTSLTLTAFSGGLPLPSRGFSLARNRQFARLASEALGLGTSLDGWMSVITPDVVRGFSLFADTAVNFIDGADATDRMYTRSILPVISLGQDQFTEVSVVNPNSDPANATIDYYATNGTLMGRRQVVIGAHGLLRDLAQNIVPETADKTEGYLLITADRPLVPHEVFGNTRRLGALNAQSITEGWTRIYFPQFASGGLYGTTIGAVNLEDHEIILRVFAYRNDGTLFTAAGGNPRVVPVPARGEFLTSVQTLFGIGGAELNDGWLMIESNRQADPGPIGIGPASFGQIQGFVSYGNDQQLAAVAAQATPRVTHNFSHAAEAQGFFTGLAFLNPNAADVTVSVEVFRPDGSPVGSFSLVLRPNQKISRLLGAELLPAANGMAGGFIKVAASAPIFALELFGTYSGSALANVPPQ
jgi:DNA-binding beta-propeller fold protein YncE